VQNRKESINPFYFLSVVAGVAFTVTACAFGLLILRTNRGLYSPDADPSEQPLMNLLDQHGLAILGAEVALLAVVTIAAIALDHFRGKRQLEPQRRGDAERQSGG
jgi:type IV secretory pathway VirB2 component (pilin)